MKFFLDENLSVVSLTPLSVIFNHRHSFEHAGSLELLGVDDVELYPRVKAAGVDAILSKDGRQLTNQVERRGLYDNRLSFIHLHMGKAKGSKALALELASITAGLPYVEEAWTPEPWVYRLRGLQSGFRERVSSSIPIWLDSWGSRPA